MLGNTIEGDGAQDQLNPLLEVDVGPGLAPASAPGVVIDCNRYASPSTVSNNFLSPNDGWTPSAAAEATNSAIDSRPASEG
jgi:hypothetical protein